LARKILLADDSVTAQNMGRKILADAGYEVIAVNNGSAALKKIAETKPDLVVLDVYMPGYSGLEVCQRLKESPETARTPVLLTVGKLEPFKPEEAQRVRAEGFIVKPFEASELLSALSKLEDKVVPRPEPSKGGRFARAIAAVEASDRGRGDTSEQTGWKSRIGFPDAKTVREEKGADASDFYNAVNRDLRTVVETAAEKAAHPYEEQKAQQPVAEASVDVGAVAPTGLPTDVTAEEVAAIAAAAAQMQKAEAVAKDEISSSPSTSPLTDETQPSQNQLAERSNSAVPEPQPTELKVPEAQVGAPSSTEAAPPEATAVQDEPVTMAAATHTTDVAAPRWMAVPVAVDASEEVQSLEEEMRRAYAASVPASLASEPAATSEEQVVSIASVAATSENSGADMAIAAASSYEASADSDRAQAALYTTAPEMIQADSVTPETQSGKDAFEETDAVARSVSGPAEASETAGNDSSEGTAQPAEAKALAAVSSDDAAIATPVATDASPLERSAGSFVSFVEPAQASEVTAQEETQAEPEMAEAAAVNSGFTSFVKATEPGETHANAEAAASLCDEPRIDSESVKNAAAAWESWRQIRDTNKDAVAPLYSSEDSQPHESRALESASLETASRAVAAGAEQIDQEAVSASTNGDNKDVASIVDSVLADLRPKLMEEIARKMAKK
jgi:CheY-like chemotaxis protein